MDTKQRQRLVELATKEATAAHSFAVTSKGSTGHRNPLSTCPHSDCVLIRELTQETANGKT